MAQAMLTADAHTVAVETLEKARGVPWFMRVTWNSNLIDMP
jgi:hypothetical protein